MVGRVNRDISNKLYIAGVARHPHLQPLFDGKHCVVLQELVSAAPQQVTCCRQSTGIAFQLCRQRHWIKYVSLQLDCQTHFCQLQQLECSLERRSPVAGCPLIQY
jgi:hypothetical protein